MNEATARSMRAWSAVTAAAVVPLVVALVGAWIQQTVSASAVRRDYVQIATNILSENVEAEDLSKTALRTWAVDLLQQFSPVDLSDEARSGLITGKAPLARVSIQSSWSSVPVQPNADDGFRMYTMPFTVSPEGRGRIEIIVPEGLKDDPSVIKPDESE